MHPFILFSVYFLSYVNHTTNLYVYTYKFKHCIATKHYNVEKVCYSPDSYDDEREGCTVEREGN